MATVTKTTLDVTLVISIDDPDSNEILEAEIVDEDNDSPDCYVPDTDYYVRVYRSSEDLAVSAKVNFGNISLENVSVQEEIEETIIFSGGETVSSNKIVKSNFVYSFDGLAYDIDHAQYNSNIAHTIGSKTLRATKEIFAVVDVVYITKYMKYKFRTSRTGTLLLSFVGSTS